MIGWLLGIAVLVVFAFMALSPLESLRWWADKGEIEVRRSFDMIPVDACCATSAHHFVVYLSGVGTIGGDGLSRRETAWLDLLRASVPDVVIVDDVFAYSVDNRGLLQRATEWMWRRLDRMRRRWRGNPLGMLINLRNIAKVLVSADPRYGPTQSIGLAQEIWRSLQRHGYRPGNGDPVTLIGFSGGAQMALGAGWFLSGLGIPVSMIGIGGIYGDDPGLDRMRHVWNLTGTSDRLRLIGNIAFPGRWPTAPLSTWGRAKREGRVSTLSVGPMRHDGPNAYFGGRARLADGRSYAEATRDAVARILNDEALGDSGPLR